MNLIVAVDETFGIGKSDKLLTYLPEDLKRFKQMTLGKILIMGRKTIESLPGQKLLPGRETWILSRDIKYKKEGAIVFHSVESILDYIKSQNIESNTVFVAGGAMIYDTFLPLCRTAYVTKIHADFQADTHMINLDFVPEFYIAHVGASKTYGLFEYTYIEYRQKEQ